jgi:hypothetical protein
MGRPPVSCQLRANWTLGFHAERDSTGAVRRLIVYKDCGVGRSAKLVQCVLVNLGRRLPATDLTGKCDRVGEQADAELVKQRTRAVGAVAGERDHDAARPEHLQERDAVLVKPREREE